MATITADLVPSAADDHAAFVTLNPQSHAWSIQTTQREIYLSQERRQHLNIDHPALLKFHSTSQPSEPGLDLIELRSPVDEIGKAGV